MSENNALVAGSIGSIAMRDNTSIAKAFLNATDIILVDTSGSMDIQDSTGGQKRYDVACQELRKLQKRLQGQLAIFSFSNECIFCPSGNPIYLGDETNLLEALQHVEGADGTVNYTIISDGYPSGNESEIFALVSRMTSRVNCIFAGPVEDYQGRDFLYKLAQVGRGKSTVAANATDLGESAMKLLAGAS